MYICMLIFNTVNNKKKYNNEKKHRCCLVQYLIFQKYPALKHVSFENNINLSFLAVWWDTCLEEIILYETKNIGYFEYKQKTKYF